MKRTIRPNSGPGFRRRGVTLVEMLVTVAMLVIIMTILAQVFQAATGALTAATTIQQLDDQMKLLDSTMRSDLNGVTARFTPPLDPALNLGYFEYGENEFADSQGEDCDDYIRFTAKAPAGRPFTGRMWIAAPAFSANVPGDSPTFYNGATQPVTVTSEYAEIIYFLRNGNLYRRVLLVAPERQSSIVPALSVGNTPNMGFLRNSTAFTTPTAAAQFFPSIFNSGGANTIPVSWQGVNDLSARPAASGPSVQTLSAIAPAQQLGAQATQTIVLNTLGDLTNRENRFAYSRFANDFINIANNGGLGPDGLADDVNADNVPDYYPTLYAGAFPSAAGGISNGPANASGNALELIYEPNYNNFVRPFLGVMGFPFVFPGAYSKSQLLSGLGQGYPSGAACGWIHAPSPNALVPASGGCSTVAFDANPMLYLQNLNHNPIDIGDNLPTLSLIETEPLSGKLTAANLKQTWWGFPTWRETLSPFWTDPTVQVNVGQVSLVSAQISPQQPAGLGLLSQAEMSRAQVNNYNSNPPRDLLPSTTATWRSNADPFSDGYGDNGTTNYFFASGSPLWFNYSWEDDLIMTGVRSFDVKAYDNALNGYGDLGWGDDLRLYASYSTYAGYPYTGNNPAVPTIPPYIAGTSLSTLWPPLVATNTSLGGTPFATLATMAHEGRMPPLVEDNRLDYQNPNPTYLNYATTPAVLQYPGTYPNYTSNIGDDNPWVVRLRRVWDTWSTEYSKAPATGIDATGYPYGPPFSPPIYPSYPPPYPAPLRRIQIQIRVADPSNQRIKSITIRQDFTDKL